MPHKCDSPFNEADLNYVIRKWEGLVNFFPKDPEKQSLIMERIAYLPNCRSELLWLKDKVIDDGDWHGVARVRELFCSRFPPADRIEPDAYTGEMAGIVHAALPSGDSPKYLPPPEPDPIDELEMTVWRERLIEQIRQVREHNNLTWTKDGNPNLKVVTQELRELEERLASEAKDAPRRPAEEHDRKVADLQAQIEMRRQKPMEGGNDANPQA